MIVNYGIATMKNYAIEIPIEAAAMAEIREAADEDIAKIQVQRKWRGNDADD
jgi:uncharacterized protein (DUF39 family)